MTADSSGLTGPAATPAVTLATVLAGGPNVEEVQTVRVGANNAFVTGGTWTLTFDPPGAAPAETTAPIAWDATPEDIEAALVALPGIGGPEDVSVTGTGNVNLATINVQFTGDLSDTDIEPLTADATALTGAPLTSVWTSAAYDTFQPHWFDARRSSLNTNDLRGKVLRIKVAEDGSYTSVPGNLFPAGTPNTRPEIYAMGFRNPFRIQVDSDDVAYVTDYSPDCAAPTGHALRGPRGTGRMEIVRKPANYGWPICMKPDLPMYKWNFNTTTTLVPPLGETWECGNPDQGPPNASAAQHGAGGRRRS